MSNEVSKEEIIASSIAEYIIKRISREYTYKRAENSKLGKHNDLDKENVDLLQIARFQIDIALMNSMYTNKMLSTFSESKDPNLSTNTLIGVGAYILIIQGQIASLSDKELRELFIFLQDKGRALNIFELIEMVVKL